MKTAAIVAEYNPMHTGHIYHLEKTREISGADFVIAIMSGDFTQRGEGAIWDKWTRSRIAVQSGVDLVLELPFVFACNSAEYFASGALSILKGLGCVDVISFGSEAGEIGVLESIAELLSEEPREYKEILRENLDEGKSFPAAREIAVSQILGRENGKTLRSPNNILAVEYIKAARKWELPSSLMTIKRKGEYHDMGTKGEMASATAIRREILMRREEEIISFLPAEGKKALQDEDLNACDPEKFFPLIRAAVLRSSNKVLQKIFGINEGMENRIMREIRKHESLENFVSALVSKRYTRVGIQRLLIHTLVGFEKQSLFDQKPYGRVLALNSKGGRLIRTIKEKGNLEIITNINKVQRPPLMRYDILASDFYNLAMGKNLYASSDFIQAPFILPQKIVD